MEENNQETVKVDNRPRADFMLDVRKSIYDVEAYWHWLSWLTKGSVISYRRLFVGLAIIVGTGFGYVVVTNLNFVYEKSSFLPAFIILVIASLLGVRGYWARVGRKSELSMGFDYFYSLFWGSPIQKNKLNIVDVEDFDGVGIGKTSSKRKVIGFEVEGAVSKTMFDGDVRSIRGELTSLRNLLPETVGKIKIQSIASTDFQPQRAFLKKYQGASDYSQKIAQGQLDVLDSGTDKVERTYLFFSFINDYEYNIIINDYIIRLLNGGVLKKARIFSKQELEEFIKKW